MLAKDRLDRPWPNAKTVDPDEIARFTALAEEWWNPEGRFRPIHRFNPVRRDYIVDRIARHFGRNPGDETALAGLRILDVGCGAGLLCEPLAERGAEVVGIDATARNIEIARWHAAGRWLADNDLDDEEGCVLRRIVTSEGRSRGYINGNTVPMQTLRELGALNESRLVDYATSADVSGDSSRVVGYAGMLFR